MKLGFILCADGKVSYEENCSSEFEMKHFSPYTELDPLLFSELFQ